MSEDEKKSFTLAKTESITVEIGSTGDKVTINALNCGQRRKLREQMENIEADYDLAAATYLALACPEFCGEIDKVFEIEKDDDLRELFQEALKLNGVVLNADEEAGKNSESDQS